MPTRRCITPKPTAETRPATTTNCWRAANCRPSSPTTTSNSFEALPDKPGDKLIYATGATMASDEQAIRTLMATWHSASAAGDVDAVLALMSDDVVFLMAGQPPMRGRDAFAAGMRGLLAQHRLVSNGTIEEIEVTG